MKKLLIILTVLISLISTSWAAETVNLKQTKYGQQDDIAQFFLPAPTWIDQVSITGGANTSYTIPSTAIYIVISAPSSDFWVKIDAAAVVPIAGITDGTGSFLNPAQFNVRGVTTIGFISASSIFITIAVYE